MVVVYCSQPGTRGRVMAGNPVRVFGGGIVGGGVRDGICAWFGGWYRPDATDSKEELVSRLRNCFFSTKSGHVRVRHVSTVINPKKND